MKWALVVDDDPASVEILSRMLRETGFHAVPAASAETALEQLTAASFEVILLDVNLPGKSGVEALPEILRAARQTPVIMVSAYGAVPVVVQAMQHGARDFLEKPVDPEKLRERLGALGKRQEHREPTDFGLLGRSPALARLFEQLKTVASTSAPVLLMGQSGTGKEVAARAIHRLSSVSAGPFVAVNLAAVSPTLIESELFGHQAGAYTGADVAREGYFRAAAGGTVFLDEIGDLPLELQARLLRVVQEKEVVPIGSTTPVPVTARVVMATHRDLQTMVAQGRFREDLYYRINALTVRLPPLSQRPEDVAELARAFAAEAAHSQGKPVPGFDENLLAAMGRYAWPGNVRELRQVVERAVLFNQGPVLSRLELPGGGLLPGEENGPAHGFDDAQSLGLKTARALHTREAEKTAILQAIQESSGNMSAAARLLQVDRSTLYRMMKRHGL